MLSADKNMNTRDEIKLTEWSKCLLGQTVSALGEAISSANDTSDQYRSLSAAQKAQRLLTGFFSEIAPSPKLTEDEAGFSSSLHTYLRKYEDSDVSVILYRLFSDGIGANVWLAFVKGLLAEKYDVRDAMEHADKECTKNNTTNNLLMLHALKIWQGDGLERAVKEIKSWE